VTGAAASGGTRRDAHRCCMQARALEVADRSSWFLVFDEGDRVISSLTSFARSKGLRAGSFQGIGAFYDATPRLLRVGAETIRASRCVNR
jgi:predicted DNA-binding protein with PD1-like motif